MITFLALSLASAHGAAASLAMDGYFGRNILQAPSPVAAMAPTTADAAMTPMDETQEETFMSDSTPFDAAEAPAADEVDLPPGFVINEEEDLDRGPCAPSSIEGFVCQKAHVNGTLRIHWTPFTVGDTKADMAVELIGRTVGWVAIAWTDIPTNMIGSKAVIVTDSIPGGMGVFELAAKDVNQINPISGTEPGFLVNNMTVIRDQTEARVVGTFTRTFDSGFAGDQIYRMIGAAGATNELVYHQERRRAYKFSLSSPGPAPGAVSTVVLPPGVSAPPGQFSPATPSVGVPVPNPSVADDGTPLPPGTPAPGEMTDTTAMTPAGATTDTTTASTTTTDTDTAATPADATADTRDVAAGTGDAAAAPAESAELDSGSAFGMLAGVSAACVALGATLLA